MELTGHERVLEIGTGFGFQTALLARPAATLSASSGQEEVVLFERTAHGLQRRELLTFASFVPLPGRYGFPD